MATLSYARGRKSRNWRWILATAALALVVGAIVLAARDARFSYGSICGTCAAHQFTTEWQIPYTQHTYWTSSSTRATPLSNVLTTSGAIPPHPHTWMMVQGSGNGIRCALGTGTGLWSVSQRPYVVTFVDAVVTHDDRATIDAWLARLRHPDDVRNFDFAIIQSHFPIGAKPDRSAYFQWKDEHQDEWDACWAQFDAEANAARAGIVQVPEVAP